MNKSFISYCFNIVVVCSIIVLSICGLYWVAIVIPVVCYLLFGFVYIAVTFLKMYKFKLASFFLSITIPITLLPTKRSHLYLFKTILILRKEGEELSQKIEKARLFFNKVDLLYLHSTYLMSTFYSISAYFHLLNIEIQKAVDCVDYAHDILQTNEHNPHLDFVEGLIEKVSEELNKLST